jgi:hypothetical protein
METGVPAHLISRIGNGEASPNDGQAFLQLRKEGRGLGQDEKGGIGHRHLHDDAAVAARADAALGSLPPKAVSKDPEAKKGE